MNTWKENSSPVKSFRDLWEKSQRKFKKYISDWMKMREQHNKSVNELALHVGNSGQSPTAHMVPWAPTEVILWDWSNNTVSRMFALQPARAGFDPGHHKYIPLNLAGVISDLRARGKPWTPLLRPPKQHSHQKKVILQHRTMKSLWLPLDRVQVSHPKTTTKKKIWHINLCGIHLKQCWGVRES